MQTQTATTPAANRVPPDMLNPDHEPVAEQLFIGWRFGTGAAIVNYLNDRLQLQFDFGMYPDEDRKRQLRKHGFHFAKSQGFAWQRPLDWDAINAAADMDWLWPCSGISPVELQPDLVRRDLPPWV